MIFRPTPEPPKMISERIHEFLEATSAHGLPRTITKNRKEKLFWICVCTAVYATVIYITGSIIHEYFMHAKGCSWKAICGEIIERTERKNLKNKAGYTANP